MPPFALAQGAAQGLLLDVCQSHRRNARRECSGAGNRSRGSRLSDLLIGFATEVANTVDNLYGDLDRRMEALRTPQLPRPLNGSPGLPQDNDRVLRLPE